MNWNDDTDWAESVGKKCSSKRVECNNKCIFFRENLIDAVLELDNIMEVGNYMIRKFRTVHCIWFIKVCDFGKLLP